jgi:hypothetical protein
MSTDNTTDETWETFEAAREAAALFDERAVTAAWLDQQTFPPLEWTVEGILPEGMGLLAAPPKAGKSWMVANIGLACAAGGLALAKIPVKARPVLYLALEDGHRRLQSRFRTLMEDQALPAKLEVVTRASSGEALVIVDEFLRRHQHDAPLVIVDTLGKVKPPKASWEDSYQADYRFGGALKARIDTVPGGCLLLVHHTRKAESADFIDTVSGTQGIAGSADFVLVLSRKRHSDEALLAVTGRDVHENEYALTTHDGRWTLEGNNLRESATAAAKRRDFGQLGDRSREGADFVNSRPAGTRAADLALHLDIEEKVAGNLLGRLHESGRIGKRTRGLYTPLVEVVEVVESQVDTATEYTTSTRVVETELSFEELADQDEPAEYTTSTTSTTHPDRPES